ncbi:hypothetical protein [Streptomyces narbonensis]|uniref:hypothetical protein n=1 Tax=Streptomyces narbonensis TaxID=67333 RepID=UPI0016781B79|nr:hypothetical protein [Streptomyces narbonensis]GGV94399.1 hypothetical protein GCM10010230_07450 [Streptomyces narbonensis]
MKKGIFRGRGRGSASPAAGSQDTGGAHPAPSAPVDTGQPDRASPFLVLLKALDVAVRVIDIALRM